MANEILGLGLGLHNLGGKRAGAGRKPRVTTPEMIADLTKLNKEDFCEKYSCGDNYFLNLYYKNVGMKEAVVEVVKEIPVVKSTDIFDGILAFTDILYSEGYASWERKIQETLSSVDKKICDILHKIEMNDVSQVQKLALYDMLREARLERRLVTDSTEFSGPNKHKIIDFLNLKKFIDGRRDFMKSRIYTVRVLTDEFGKTLSADEK